MISDEDFHNTGVSWGKEALDLGRYEVTKNDADRGKFKTPTLCNVALTAPYMHWSLWRTSSPFTAGVPIQTRVSIMKSVR